MQPDNTTPGGISDSVVSGDVHHHHYTDQAGQPVAAAPAAAAPAAAAPVAAAPVAAAPVAAAPQVVVVQQQQQQQMAAAGPTVIQTGSQKSTTVAYLLWFFLGWLGIHRFYTGHMVTGIIWFLTGALCGFGWLIDIFLIPGLVRESGGTVIVYP
jgi:TM2 domain-containing membrane protein YozV